jgi:hypothetical protein
MQYMCLIYDDETVWQTMPEDQRNGIMGEYMGFTASIRTSGNMVAGDALQPTSTATTVRVRNGETLTPTARSRRPRSSSVARTDCRVEPDSNRRPHHYHLAARGTPAPSASTKGSRLEDCSTVGYPR